MITVIEIDRQVIFAGISLITFEFGAWMIDYNKIKP